VQRSDLHHEYKKDRYDYMDTSPFAMRLRALARRLLVGCTAFLGVLVMLGIGLNSGSALAGVPADGPFTEAATTSKGESPVAVIDAPTSNLKNPAPVSPATILYDQYNDLSYSATTSQNFDPAFDAYDAETADDFYVEPYLTWFITSVEVSGVYVGEGEPDSVNVIIYNRGSNNGPDTPVYTQTNIPYVTGANPGDMIIDLPEPVALTWGNYFLSVQANEELQGGGQWYWRNRRTQASQRPAYWRNPGGGFGRSSCIGWGVRNWDCSISWFDYDQVFRLIGHYNITPTPAPSAPPGDTSTPTPTSVAPTGTPGVPPPILTADATIGVPPSTPTPAACGADSNYIATQSTGASIITGTTDIGLHCVSCMQSVSLPFPVTVYGESFTTAWISTDGFMFFYPEYQIAGRSCLPYFGLNYAVYPYWTLMRTDGPDQGVYTSVTGVEPNRIYNVEWRAGLSDGSGPANLEVRFHENSRTGRIDFVYGDITYPVGGTTIGIQRRTDLYTQVVCGMPGGIERGTQITFDQPDCGTATPTVTGTPPTRTPTRTRTPTQTRTSTPTPTSTPTVGCGLYWHIVDVPNVPQNDNYLMDVAVISADDIWAVGYQAVPGSYNYTLTMHWDGVAWSVVQSPNTFDYSNRLLAVAASSPNEVWAVGERSFIPGYGGSALILYWNGINWNPVGAPAGTPSLTDVAAISATDAWAVGGTQTTATIHWNGAQWATVTSPNPGTYSNELHGVTAVSPNELWAVGVYYDGGCCAGRTLTMHWTGAQWDVVPSPNLGGYSSSLKAVDAVGPNNVWAVGDADAPTGNAHNTLIEHWDGTAWTIVDSPSPGSEYNFLSGLHALSANDIWAVGSYWLGTYRTLTLHWNGSGWSVVPSPNPGSVENQLFGVAAVAPSDAWAVGYRYSGPPSANLVLHYNDVCTTPTPIPSWTAVPTDTVTPTATATVPSATPPLTHTPTSTRTAAPTACTTEFTDVPDTNTFYPFVRCLACRGIINGYTDGTFRPNNPVTRGQLSKIVSNSAGFSEPVSGQTFEDVMPGSTFYEFVERLTAREIIAGYTCGGPNEPCVPPAGRPYFRPNAGATRGQLTKIVSNAAGFDDTIPQSTQTFEDVAPTHTFWVFVERLLLNRPDVMGGYPCGGEAEPCVPPADRPYFRPGNPLTRGQTSKIVANTFFPGCNPPLRK
jgi:hypothetical protein